MKTPLSHLHARAQLHALRHHPAQQLPVLLRRPAVPLLRDALRHSHAAAVTVSARHAAVAVHGHTRLPPAAVCAAPAPAAHSIIITQPAVTATAPASCTCLRPVLWRQLDHNLGQGAPADCSSSSSAPPLPALIIRRLTVAGAGAAAALHPIRALCSFPAALLAAAPAAPAPLALLACQRQRSCRLTASLGLIIIACCVCC